MIRARRDTEEYSIGWEALILDRAVRAGFSNDRTYEQHPE